MASKFIIQENIVTNKITGALDGNAGKEVIIGRKLLRKESEEHNAQPCVCPIQEKHETTYTESINTDIVNNKLFKGSKGGLVQQVKTEKTVAQKNCSSQCIAFQLIDKKGKTQFKCNWGKFTYDITETIKNPSE